MSKWQRRVLIGGLLLVFLAGLFPPVLTRTSGQRRVHVPMQISNEINVVVPDTSGNDYQPGGRTFLPYPPALGSRGSDRINYGRLVVEWITIGSLAAAVILLLKPQQAGRER